MASVEFRGVRVAGPIKPEYKSILSAEFLEFVGALHRNFNDRRLELLHAREQRKKLFDAGLLPSFLEETAWIRESEWKAAPIPADLQDRRVEITGPVDRKMVINALNSGAKTFMADFEDSLCPTWFNVVDGAVNLRDAVRRTISMNSGGKDYKLKSEKELAVLIVRPRGWHLEEAHIIVDGKPTSGSLFDFALYFFHNAHELIKRGSGPYFYLPKMESHLEARLWNSVFVFSQNYIRIPQGTIRATVLIETILGAFEMDEIIYELREHSSGLNCGRWDYIFSFIKKFRNHPKLVLPDRAQVTMSVPWMSAYVRLLIQTCHRRGVHAMGGMAAQIPIKDDEKANKAAMEKVRNDKLLEVQRGHDGTWVAHPGLVSIALEIFNQHMPTPNQIHRVPDTKPVHALQLLEMGKGEITLAGVRSNVSVGLRYIEAWLRGLGCVPIDNLMEDAATAEISRTQLWQWIKNESKTNDGKIVTLDLVLNILNEEVQKLKNSSDPKVWASGKYELAAKLYQELLEAKVLPDFLTHAAYEHITTVLPAAKL